MATTGPGWSGTARASDSRDGEENENAWKPVEQQHLLSTLMTDWDEFGKREWTHEEQAMRDLALTPARELELPHPPNFVKEIMVSEHRALLEDYHEAQMNYTLTAHLPPSVRIARNAPHVTIFRELFTANTDASGCGQVMMRRLLQDVKRFVFDGYHTLSFVFYSKRLALLWTKKAYRFQRAVLILNDTHRRPEDEGTGSFTPAQLQLQYAIRIYGAGKLGLTPLARAVSEFAGAKVLDVEYPRSVKTDIYDNRFHTVTFAQTACPDALTDVTHIELDGTPIVVHHFQANLRMPCSRCYSSRHGMKKYKVPPHAIAAQRARFSRVFKGKVEKVAAITSGAYQVTDITELIALLAVQQSELANNVSPKLEPIEAVASPATASPPATPPTENRVDTIDAARQTKGSNGFVTKHSKRASRTNTSRTEASASPANAEPVITPGPAPSASSKKKKKKKAGKRRTSGTTKTRFVAFQRDEALGHYGALMDSDSDSEDDPDAMDISDSDTNAEVDDAPYAYAGDETGSADVDMDNGPAPVSSSATTKAGAADAVATEFPTRHPEQQQVVDAHAAQIDANDAMGEPTALTQSNVQGTELQAKQRRTNSAGRQPQAGAAPADSPLIARTDLVQRTMVDYVQSEAPREQQIGTSQQMVLGAPARDVHPYIPASPVGSEDFTMGPAHAGTDEGDADLPIQVMLWLKSFDGQPVEVDAAGQCALLALHATTSNYDGPKLPRNGKVTRGANKLKRVIYALMMSNLRRDVELGLVDPVEELQRLYPDREHGTGGVASATASLLAHYAEERQRSVTATVPACFWAGRHELRAMAQYLREPLLVLDANEHNDAHIQRYMYKTHRLRDGSDHESGYCEVLHDRVARDYLYECWLLRHAYDHDPQSSQAALCWGPAWGIIVAVDG